MTNRPIPISGQPNLVTRKPVYIPDSNTPHFCVASVQAYGLVEKTC